MAANTGKSFLSRFAQSFKPVNGYQKYGLRIEDLYNSEAEEVREAIRRLPKKEWEAREVRVRLAHEVHLKQTLLPESSWTTPEEDSQSYIEPYLSEVVQEIEERKDYRAGVPLSVEKRFKPRA